MAFHWQHALAATALFVVSFAVSLLVVGTVLVRLPAAYFLDHPTPESSVPQHPVLRLLFRVGKNLLGMCLVIIGVLLSIPGIPGQGVLTVLIGVMLLDLPGKRRLERAILSRPRVLALANRLRRRFDRPPLRLSERDSESGSRGGTQGG